MPRISEFFGIVIAPIFEPLLDPAELGKVSVDPELGTIVWPNGADICPDVLYHGRSPASLAETSQ